MENYEIRIVLEGSAPITYACSYVSDHAAVRRAQALTSKRDTVEVWRGEACVYAQNSRTTLIDRRALRPVSDPPGPDRSRLVPLSRKAL